MHLLLAIAGSLALSAALPAQEPLATFSRLFTEGVDLAVKVNAPGLSQQQRAAAAETALGRLEEAVTVIPRLPTDRQAKARFWAGVWRAEVHWRHGTPEAREAAAREAQASRSAAMPAGAYRTYYRVQCLIILWRCLSSTVFEELVRDPRYGDRAYLLGKEVEAELAKGKATDLVWPLRLMRCDLRLLEDTLAAELWAVEELRKIAGELEASDDPSVAEWRRLCLQMLAWHYMELRDWRLAQVWVGKLPGNAKDTRSARVWIARARQDWNTVFRLGEELGREDDTYYLLVAEALEAKGEYRQALKAVEKVFRKPGRLADPGVAETRAAALDQEADLYLRLAEREPAERKRHLEAVDRALTRAWDALHRIESRQALAERAEILKDQGRLLELRKQPEEAYLKYVESINQLETVRSAIPVYWSGTRFLDQDPEQLAAVDGVLRTYADAGYGLTEALVGMDRLKSRDLLDWLAQPLSAKHLARYRRVLRDVAMGVDHEGPSGRSHALEDLAVAERSRRRGQSIHGSIEMNRLLEAFPDTCFLCYWAGEESVYLAAIVTGSTGARQLVRLGDRDEALRLMAAAYVGVGTPPAGSQPWQALDTAAAFFLPAPVRPMLGRVQRVVVCPAADLHRLPFAALRIDGQALGVAKELTNVPSLAILRELSTRASTGNGLVLVHSPDATPAQAQLHLRPLRFSEREASLVAANYEVLAARHGPGATFTNLRADLETHVGRVGVVHLSAHAVEHPGIPSRSLLMLSDGPADMRSMADLQLRGSLVVLSNCLSLGAEASGGEGVNGLIWGPLAAGARAVVASQWPVNQQATADLMGQFHYFRSHGNSDAEAMRRARERLASADNYKHPFYWAGFDVVGAPAEGRSAGSWGYGWLLAAAGVLLACYMLRKSRRT